MKCPYCGELIINEKQHLINNPKCFLDGVRDWKLAHKKMKKYFMRQARSKEYKDGIKNISAIAEFIQKENQKHEM